MERSGTVVLVLDEHWTVRSAGRLSWQRTRAWIEVFSSAERTKSRLPRRFPVPLAREEVGQAGRLRLEVSGAREDPRAVPPTPHRVLGEPAPHRSTGDLGDDPTRLRLREDCLAHAAGSTERRAGSATRRRSLSRRPQPQGDTPVAGLFSAVPPGPKALEIEAFAPRRDDLVGDIPSCDPR
jgi:hypothetical protein